MVDLETPKEAKADAATVRKKELRKEKVLRTLSVAAAFNCSSWFMMIPARYCIW